MGDERVVVSVTPNGYADAVCGDLFVTPFEMEMLFSDFLSVLRSQRQPQGPAHCPAHTPEGVYYIQQQNSNFTLSQYSSLKGDTEDSIPWVAEAFSKYNQYHNTAYSMRVKSIIVCSLTNSLKPV